VNLARNDWLRLLVEHHVRPLVGAAPPGRLPGLKRARKLLSQRLTDLGLLYGTPLLPADLAPDQAPRERLFLALIAGLIHLGHELADALSRPNARRHADLAAIFLAWAGEGTEAQKLAATAAPTDLAVARAFSRAAQRLTGKMELLTADPVYGVPLHNGLTYVDALTFGRLALAFFASGKLDARAAARRLADGAHEQEVLVEALVLLVWADGEPSLPLQRALARQIGSLGLPRARTRALRKALQHPSAPAALAERVRGREHRRFVLAQAILASLIDGRRSPGERRFLAELARAFGFTPVEVSALEAELAGFYAEHREYVDTFTASEAGIELADELVDDLSRKVEKNLAAVLTELRQTGELAELLAKVARGNTLSSAERGRLRLGLLDLAKVVPSLAILAAPGGFFLLAALTKVLPFSILPSAWDKPVPKRQAD
jgi:hypothetical protein